MNYQNADVLRKKFKVEKGWEVVDGFDIEIYNEFWMILIEGMSRYDDGCDYPYINLHLRLGNDGHPKQICSFRKLKDCIEYIKAYGVV